MLVRFSVNFQNYTIPQTCNIFQCQEMVWSLLTWLFRSCICNLSSEKTWQTRSLSCSMEMAAVMKSIDQELYSPEKYLHYHPFRYRTWHFWWTNIPGLHEQKPGLLSKIPCRRLRHLRHPPHRSQARTIFQTKAASSSWWGLAKAASFLALVWTCSNPGLVDYSDPY